MTVGHNPDNKSCPADQSTRHAYLPPTCWRKVADRPDRTWSGTADPSACMARAAVMDASVGGCANAGKNARGSGSPGCRWCAARPDAADCGVQDSFEGGGVARQVRALKKPGMIPPKGITADLHSMSAKLLYDWLQ